MQGIGKPPIQSILKQVLDKIEHLNIQGLPIESPHVNECLIYMLEQEILIFYSSMVTIAACITLTKEFMSCTGRYSYPVSSIHLVLAADLNVHAKCL